MVERRPYRSSKDFEDVVTGGGVEREEEEEVEPFARGALPKLMDRAPASLTNGNVGDFAFTRKWHPQDWTDPKQGFWQCQTLDTGLPCSQPVTLARRAPKTPNLL